MIKNKKIYSLGICLNQITNYTGEVLISSFVLLGFCFYIIPTELNIDYFYELKQMSDIEISTLIWNIKSTIYTLSIVLHFLFVIATRFQNMNTKIVFLLFIAYVVMGLYFLAVPPEKQLIIFAIFFITLKIMAGILFLINSSNFTIRCNKGKKGKE